jgi:glutathione peroxidase
MMGPVRTLALLALAIAAAGVATGCAGDDATPAGAAATPTAGSVPPGDGRGPSVLRTPIRLLDGTTLRPAALRGRVVLVVNTASRCGYTPQFEGLEALHRSKRADGLTVVGFPSDDFRQELRSGEEIAAFCELNYGVSFPMAEEGAVTGARAQPLFARIAARPGPAGEEPAWNFTKYLLDREGRLVARFGSSVEPDHPSLVAAVDRLLDEEA